MAALAALILMTASAVAAACGQAVMSSRGYIEFASERAGARPSVRTMQTLILRKSEGGH